MQLINKKEAYKNGDIVLTEKTYKVDDKELKRVSLSLGKNAVLVIPTNENGNFFMVKQKRGNPKTDIIEFPSGGIENGESELVAAKRELSEELGLQGEMQYLGKFRPFYSLVDLSVSVFLCKGAQNQDDAQRMKPDFYEKIEKIEVSEKELYRFIKDEKVRDSYTLGALAILKSIELG